MFSFLSWFADSNIHQKIHREFENSSLNSVGSQKRSRACSLIHSMRCFPVGPLAIGNARFLSSRSLNILRVQLRADADMTITILGIVALLPSRKEQNLVSIRGTSSSSERLPFGRYSLSLLPRLYLVASIFGWYCATIDVDADAGANSAILTSSLT